MTKNPVLHSKSKHIEIGHHYISELVDKKEIELKFCKMGEQFVDIFTKPISTDRYRVQKTTQSSRFFRLGEC